jgi:hypothetical protein
MTTQSLEKIINNRRKVIMESELLGSYMAILKEKLRFFAVSSGCWRGYVGTCEIKNEKLS